MSKNELHDWESNIKQLGGKNTEALLAIAQDIYDTAYARGKSQNETPEITNEDIRDAIKQGYNDGYEMAKAKFERPKCEWIDANKQIPDDCITVLIWFEYYRYGDYNCMYQTFGLGYTIDGKWSPFINGETGWRDAHIIAWQPIEPYGADMRGTEE